MSLYNLSQFLKLLKEDAEIGDLPLPVSDQEIIEHFDMKTLVDFSLICPFIEEVTLGPDNVDTFDRQRANQYQVYKIPKYVYDGTCIVNVFDFQPYHGNGINDLYMPNNAGWASPDAIIGAMADVRLAAGLASGLSKAPTIKFKKPNKILAYNSWMNGYYVAEVGLKHSLSLATVEPGTFYTLRKLAIMDFKSFLYSKLKRKDNIETGVGSVDMKISEWSNISEERDQWYRELLDDSNLSYSHIIRF